MQRMERNKVSLACLSLASFWTSVRFFPDQDFLWQSPIVHLFTLSLSASSLLTTFFDGRTEGRRRQRSAKVVAILIVKVEVAVACLQCAVCCLLFVSKIKWKVSSTIKLILEVRSARRKQRLGEAEEGEEAPMSIKTRFNFKPTKLWRSRAMLSLVNPANVVNSQFRICARRRRRLAAKCKVKLWSGDGRTTNEKHNDDSQEEFQEPCTIYTIDSLEMGEFIFRHGHRTMQRPMPMHAGTGTRHAERLESERRTDRRTGNESLRKWRRKATTNRPAGKMKASESCGCVPGRKSFPLSLSRLI